MNAERFRILCIDDDANTGDWIRFMLRSARLNVAMTTVRNGRKAFTILNREIFDLCIMDYALPDMTGVQLCSLLRQSCIKIPIMFFTAMGRPIDRERAVGAGADDYLCKPDDLDIFVSSVTRLLTRPRPVYIPYPQFADLQKAA